MSTDPYYITTPIYYVNDKPHIGTSYTTILADTLARYHRLAGRPVHFLTGTDEHGQKVQGAAEAAGMTPQEQADQTVVRFKELWDRLELTHDDFIRTTEERHTRVVQAILQDLWDKGEIYKDEYEGWYSVSEERFYTEKELVDGLSPEGKMVEKVTEANYFFKMSGYQDWLVQYIADNPEFIQPDFRRNETLGFLKKPLGDLCISRPKSRLSWGIELPFDSEYVCYVWFDALVNYISAVGYKKDDESFAKWWPASCHLIGKDILTTHTVYWPTMLKAMGVEMPQSIFAHGWWLSGEEKMSKSSGNAVDPMDYLEKHGVDPFRYFLLAEMSLGQDAGFTDEIFTRRYNSDLANDLGNLASRVTKMTQANCGGVVPEASGDVLEGEESKALWEQAQEAVRGMPEAIARMRPDQGIAEVMGVVRAGNVYLEKRKPWLQAKEDDKQPLQDTMRVSAEVLRVVAGLLYPVMPEKMVELRVALGAGNGAPVLDRLQEWGVLPTGTPMQPLNLFPRIQVEKAPQPKKGEGKKKGKSVSNKAERAPVGVVDSEHITFDEFGKIDLKTAKVIEAEKVEGTDKLLRLEVLVGDERRQIVAGIAQHYDPEKLIGMHIIIVANLKPAKIRGVESKGMLLAAKKGEKLCLVTVDGELASGASVG